MPSSISFLSNETVEMKPIGSEMSFSRSNSRMSFSMAMSSSFRSMESPRKTIRNGIQGDYTGKHILYWPNRIVSMNN